MSQVCSLIPNTSKEVCSNLLPCTATSLLCIPFVQVLGDDVNEPVDIGDLEDLAQLADPSLDGIIVGAPTWNTGWCSSSTWHITPAAHVENYRG